jgi:predicted nucleotide-binding protein (sugar kinase/HSP70/actin superfamily)
MFFYNLLTTKKTKIEEIFLRNNLIDDAAISQLDHIKRHVNCPITMDLVEMLKYFDSERLERTIWIHPINSINLHNLKKFFEITHKCGIVLDARVKRARKYPNK